MKDIHAQLRYLRMSPRKVRLVIDAIRGLHVDLAEQQLSFSRKAAARPVLKLLRSAIANAQNNFQVQRKELYVKTVFADGGPTLKRFRPRAMGASAPIRKRTSHITIVLVDRTEDTSKNALAAEQPLQASQKEPRSAQPEKTGLPLSAKRGPSHARKDGTGTAEQPSAGRPKAAEKKDSLKNVREDQGKK